MIMNDCCLCLYYDFCFGNTAQSWRSRYAVRFFVRLYENDAAGLTPSKEFSCKMTENMQVDALPSRQAGFVRCCLYPRHICYLKRIMHSAAGVLMVGGSEVVLSEPKKKELKINKAHFIWKG